MSWTTDLAHERMRRYQANAFRARLAARHDYEEMEHSESGEKHEPKQPEPARRKVAGLLRGSWFPGRAITVPS